MTSETASGGTAARAHLLVAGVSGLAVTVLEFAAVRFMAPSFGQSNYVWANVVGVILLALALGYWFGGRLADRRSSGRALYTAYLLASAYVITIAFLGGMLCEALVPREVGNVRLLPLAFTGSLVATLLLFGPPTFVLGMTSPFLIRLDDAPGRAGRVSGRIFAVGTLGSLVGCYLGPLYLFPTVGSRASILLCAAALAALGVGGLVLGRKRSGGVGTGVGALLFVAALGSSVWVAATDMPLRRHPGQLAEIESAYQTIRVVEADAQLLGPSDYPLYGETLEVTTRFLRHDEDAETYQSVWLPDDSEALLVGGRYYEHLALGAWFRRDADAGASDRLRVFVIGYAGGAVHRVLRLTKPPDSKLSILGVEIDPAVVETSRRWLALAELETDDVEIITGEDARTVVNALPEDELFDLVFVDAYARTTYVPFQLASVEFFEKAAAHLTLDGWIGVNLHSSGSIGAPLVRTLASTMRAAAGIGEVWIAPNPLYPGSLVLWASREGRGPPRLRAEPELPETLATPAFALERLLVRHDPERDAAHVLTDDLSDVDRLTDADLYAP